MEVATLELRHAGGRVKVPAGRPFVIGRGPDADLDLPHPRVSRRHAVVELTRDGWTLTDSSSNGTYVDDDLITVLRVDRPVVVRLGRGSGATTVELHPVPGRPRDATTPTPVGAAPTLLGPPGPGAHRTPPHGPPLAGPAPPGAGPGAGRPSQPSRDTTVHIVTSERLTIGRLPDNDVVVDDLLVSRRHAVLERRPDGGWDLTDLGSGNGTFVNGTRTQRAAVTGGDVIGVGRAVMRLQGDRLVSAVDSGDVAFTAHNLSVVVGGGKRLLDDVSFSLPGRCLLAVVGPSGAGKSTLLRALTGSRPADSGLVRYDGRDLYGAYDELRHRIGLVPQDDVLHPQLTVRRALRYAARLRFPADVAGADRDRRVEEVIAELGLIGQADQRIDTLSGGQRKRTSVALELLTKPSLLFLDEPTSGLDPGLDRSVMRTLRGLADGTDGGDGGAGRTVVVITHSVLNLDVCDLLLVLAPGGHVAYFGPPREALAFFGQPDFAEMFLLLDRVPGEVLAQQYRASEQHSRYVAAPTAALPPVPDRPAPPGSAPRQQGRLTQLGVLCRRYLAVIAADRQYAVFLAALPLVLALLARLVPGTAGLSAQAAAAERSGQPNQLLLVLVLGGALMGIAASIREIVKERPVYGRERAIGLSLGAYLTSKFLVLGVITATQAAVFTVLALLGHKEPDAPVALGAGPVEVLLAIVAVTVLSMVVGLVISAFIDNADRGMPLLVLVLMLQLVVSGGLFPVHGRAVLEQVAWLVPSRWSYAMGASTIDLNLSTRSSPDPLWEHTADQWLFSAGMLGVQLVVLLGIAAWLLRRQDPVRR